MLRSPHWMSICALPEEGDESIERTGQKSVCRRMLDSFPNRMMEAG